MRVLSRRILMTDSQMMASSSSAEDDFDFNPFYHSLQNLYSEAFEEAQRKCFLICVPQSSSIKESTFDRNFVEHHILRPSPFFKGEYLTTDKQASGKVTLSNGTLEAKEGFPEKRIAEILAEETGYNENSRQFRILLLDQPLIGPVSCLSEKVRNDGVDLYSLKISKPECVRLLGCFNECTEVMEAADRKISIFMRNYMILRGFVEDAALKLNHIHTETYEAFQSHLRISILQDHRAMSNLAQTIESFILYCVHDKVDPVLHQQCETGNSEIDAKLVEIKEIPRDILGVRSVLSSCSLKSAVSEAKKLADGVTPLQKMLCIKSIMDRITESVNSFFLSQHGNNQTDVMCLTSDDYIPLLTSVLAEARPNHLASEMYFIEHFHWSGNTKDNLEFSFVSLQASVHYILNLDLENLRSQMKSDSPVVEPPVSPPAASETPDAPQKSRRDKRLDRINRMLDKTNRELSLMKMEIGQTAALSASNVRSSMRGDPILGDFLSSLQGDSMPSCFGKQS